MIVEETNMDWSTFTNSLQIPECYIYIRQPPVACPEMPNEPYLIKVSLPMGIQVFDKEDCERYIDVVCPAFVANPKKYTNHMHRLLGGLDANSTNSHQLSSRG